MVSISLRYAQKLGPTRIRLLWESDAIAKIVIGKQYLYQTLGSQTTPYPLTVIPAATSSAHSSLANDQNYKYAVVNVQETHMLFARDQYMNQ
jgi:hypothetical protein